MENKIARKFDLEEHLWDCHGSVCETCGCRATTADSCRGEGDCHWITTGDPEDNNWIPSEYEDIE
jgi:hypothetical protein